MSQTHTSCFRQILNPLFDLYYVLEIITVGNYNGLDAGPLTLLSPYIVSLVNANGPTDVYVRHSTSMSQVTSHSNILVHGNNNITFFTWDQALWTVFFCPSVCLPSLYRSVCLSVTSFTLCSAHRIIMKYRRVIITDIIGFKFFIFRTI